MYRTAQALTRFNTPFSWFAIATFAFAVIVGAASTSASNEVDNPQNHGRPNIVLIMADDK